MANAASVSGSTGYNIPVNALDGGDAAPSSNRATFGNVSFSDGPFQVGGYGNAAPSSIFTPQGQVLPADLGSAAPSLLSGGSTTLWLILAAGGALLAWYFLRRH
jgi:hypothetical protein